MIKIILVVTLGAATVLATTVSAETVMIAADAAQLGPQLTKQQLGVNLEVAVPEAGEPTYISPLASAGVGLIRWPGGAGADYYHWQNNTFSVCSVFNIQSTNAFDAWMENFVGPLGADVAITVNYGTNPACTGRADPNEAAAWVNYANNVKHYGIKYWTIGNEQYFPLNGLQPNYNPDPVDPAAYASSVANQFYPLMKAQDPSIMVGVDMYFGAGIYNVSQDTWDQVVLADAKYDFVEMHYYPEVNNVDNDATLLTTWADQIATNFATAKSLVAMNGHAGIPIYLGEFDRDAGGSSGVGHESVSIVNALFNAIVVGEVTRAGVGMATAWLGVDNCYPDVTPISTAYGLQTFGSFGLFSSEYSGFTLSCVDKGVSPRTPFPKARAYQILRQFIVPGEHVIGVTSSNPVVRAYAATKHAGYAFLLINTDSVNTQTAAVALNNASRSAMAAKTLTYGKAEYDQSQSGLWLGPVTGELGSVGADFQVLLPPWSITLVTLGESGNAHDLNNDGFSDIGWMDGSGDVAFWLMNGATPISSGGFGGIPSMWSIVGQRDFNGDGMADLLWRDTSGDTAMWFMNGSTVASTADLGNIPMNWTVVGVADFNGDGLGDILWRDTAGDYAVWLMNGGMATSAIGLGNVPTTTWSIVGTGDFNGDGKADILWRDTSGDVSIWFMNGATVTSAAPVGAIANWSVVGTGDFNGDGKSDIVWRDIAGDAAIWLMNGAAVSSAVGVGTIPTTWSIALVGDYNGDGKSDLLWRDTSGNTAIWFMNGATIGSTAGLGNIPTNWTVQSVNAE
jgi:FG-GAP-like repeat